MLQIHNFKKEFSTGFKIQVDSLEMKPGIHLIKGENGSGKSTLLKAIAGIHEFAGDIIWEGISIKKAPVDFRRQVNYSDAEPQFPSFLSLDELIRFTQSSKGGDDVQIEELKKELKIGDFSKNPISTYSSGMLKKAGLMLAFMGKPSLIILDEPFTTIDIETQKHLKKKIVAHNQSGTSFLITSHLADFEKLIAYDSILSISDGKISVD